MEKRRLFTLIISHIAFFSLYILVCFLIYKDVTLNNISVNAVHYMTLVSLLLGVLLITVEIISLSFDQTASKMTVFISIFLTGYISTSKDMLTTLSIYYVFDYYLWIEILHSLFFVLTAFTILEFLNQTFGTRSKKLFFSTLFISIAIFIIDLLFAIFNIEWISAIVFVLTFSIYTAYVASKQRYKIDATYFFTSFILVTLVNSHMANNITISVPFLTYCHGLQAASALFISLLFVSIYIVFIINKTKRAYEIDAKERQIKDLRSTILIEQINPHFIFNSLNLIKANYHQSIDDGDLAIDLFSRHLRINVNVKGKTLIVPLQKELENVDIFVQLTNMQLKKNVNVIYNIDYYDFSVPLLSIEPFIENAIKYSRIQDKEDGYIEIYTALKDNYYEIIISDNGIGFDVEQISEKSQGIKNACERLRILLNATVDLHSEINEGTSIDIKIPKE